MSAVQPHEVAFFAVVAVVFVAMTLVTWIGMRTPAGTPANVTTVPRLVVTARLPAPPTHRPRVAGMVVESDVATAMASTAGSVISAIVIYPDVGSPRRLPAGGG